MITFPPRWNFPWHLKRGMQCHQPAQTSLTCWRTDQRRKLSSSPTKSLTVASSLEMLSEPALQPGIEMSTNSKSWSAKWGVLYFKLLVPASITFCNVFSDCMLCIVCAQSALARKNSGLAQGQKWLYKELSRRLSNSLELSSDNPEKAIRRELLVQKVTPESSLSDFNVNGSGSLYESIVVRTVEPVEALSIDSTSPAQ
jgi:hypothetical protein